MNRIAAQRDLFLNQGFIIFENVLPEEMIQDVSQIVDELLTTQSQEHFKAQRSTGSMINVLDDERFADLIAYPRALNCLANLGYTNPKWSSGFIISKPGKSPALFWHQDWWGWNHESSYEPECQMAFLMYYLVDTHKENGCLRLIPQSQIKRHLLHDILTAPHAEYRRMDTPDHPAYQYAEGEVDIMVNAGDLIIGDARLLHAAYANQRDERRTVITLWFFPDFDNMPEELKASINYEGRHGWPVDWSIEKSMAIESLKPIYTGNAEPVPWNRIPDHRLK